MKGQAHERLNFKKKSTYFGKKMVNVTKNKEQKRNKKVNSLFLT